MSLPVSPILEQADHDMVSPISQLLATALRNLDVSWGADGLGDGEGEASGVCSGGRV